MEKHIDTKALGEDEGMNEWMDDASACLYAQPSPSWESLSDLFLSLFPPFFFFTGFRRVRLFPFHR